MVMVVLGDSRPCNDPETSGNAGRSEADFGAGDHVACSQNVFVRIANLALDSRSIRTAHYHNVQQRRKLQGDAETLTGDDPDRPCDHVNLNACQD